jgi:hypothetical protein
VTLTLVVVAASHAELARFSLEYVDTVDELILLTNPEARFGGLGRIGNHALEFGRGDVVGLVHADVLFGPGAIASLTTEAARGGIAGIVGRNLAGEYIWGRDVIEPTPVSTLDSCTIFLKRSLGLCFDEKLFDSFHCCTEDLCLLAASVGIPVRVPPAVADHQGTMWRQQDWMNSYWSYREKLAAKWSNIEFTTT